MRHFVANAGTGNALKEYDVTGENGQHFWMKNSEQLLYMLFIMTNCFCHFNK